MTAADPRYPLDLVGVGIGPANLALAALADDHPDLRAAWYEQRPEFRWHPGLLIDGTTLQVPFLADLVTLADPTNPWSFLNYLRHQGRLYPFYFSERFHCPRAEYDDYCRWVSEQLPSLHFHHRVDTVRWNAEHGVFDVDLTPLAPGAGPAAPGTARVYARNLAVGIGTAPHVPEPLRPLIDARATAPVIHSADYLEHRERLLEAGHITVIGGGQSGAEVFLDLLRRRPAGAERLHWISRSPAFAPMEYSKLGLEHFTPDYARYFRELAEPVRDRLLREQWQLYRAIDHETLGEIHDELYRRTVTDGWPDAVLSPGVAVRTAGRVGAHQLELHLNHQPEGGRSRLLTNAVVLATGYRERPLTSVLAGLDADLARDAAGRPQVDEDYRLALGAGITGSVFVLNAERHTHGVGAPDLGLIAHRAATIVNALSDQPRYRLPERSAFTTFGVPVQPQPPVGAEHERRDPRELPGALPPPRSIPV
ncbi:SidA/IucD/PvdA family monooxygenase [Streptomyces sp. 3MP-14]|uniref:L-lysine N6-monooxygenase MbtG n=1 Tax=Streptomyces mimosae TaxID=2586635 RepID=A0A5N6AMA8_9ACTN|nr:MULTISPECIES: SidA/IucD/PvdA family monooxygenase [Streptomyces]KAB8168748.1 SidA/IucD/PvdA family monooxygenase [Streptomyces mimosae]KAB8177972.1 SidA/IucD/PvdA family monooxygenase [Streptomyces sp. 3MP-14]